MPPPDARQLEFFLVVAEELHFTRAADRLNVVQQTLSTAIAQLESSLGLRLFHRTTRSVRLTDAGEAWLPFARAALEALEAATRSAADLAAGRTGRLRLGLAATAALDLTPALLAAFGARRPGVVVDVEHYDLADPSAGLRSGRSDAALVRPPFAHDGLELLDVGEEPRVAVLPTDHPLAGQAQLDFADIADEAWADVDTDQEWCDFWRVAERRSRPARLGRRCRSETDMIEAARAGAAICLVAASFARSQRWPGVAFVPVADIPPSRVALAWRADDERPIVAELAGLARGLA